MILSAIYLHMHCSFAKCYSISDSRYFPRGGFDFVCRGGGVQGLFLMTLLCIKFYRVGGGVSPWLPSRLEIFIILFEWKGLIFERNNVYIVTILFEVQWPSGVGYNSFWEKIFSLIVF